MSGWMEALIEKKNSTFFQAHFEGCNNPLQMKEGRAEAPPQGSVML